MRRTWRLFRRLLRSRRFLLSGVVLLAVNVGISLWLFPHATDSKETSASHAGRWQIWSYISAFGTLLISYGLTKLVAEDKSMIQRALDDRLNDRTCNDCPLSNGEFALAVHFYDDFREDIRRWGRRSGKRQSDAMSIVLKSAVSMDKGEEIGSFLKDTNSWFNVLPRLTPSEVSYFSKLSGHLEADPNLLALLARDGDQDAQEKAMKLLERYRYHDFLVALIRDPDARETIILILQRAPDFRPTSRQTGVLLEVLASLDVGGNEYGGIAHHSCPKQHLSSDLPKNKPSYNCSGAGSSLREPSAAEIPRGGQNE
ncbi:MAG TPA: hypothetical protein VGL82_22665 [Bryobacteraceae bacterium]